MNILVTGGAGFIGSNYLLNATKKYPQNNYVCLDALTYAGNLVTIESLFTLSNFTFVQGDITDKDFVSNLFAENNFDVVVNFAAESHVDRSIDDPTIFIKTNVIGTQILMDACLKYRVSRFHQVSTDEVYGDLPLNRPDLLMSEDAPIKTSSPYSASKAAADLLVLAYHRTYKLPVTISRCSNNYGKYQYPEKLIPLMIDCAMNNQKLPVYGDGLNIRDWLHVDDHCEAINLILEKGVFGEVYNIGSNCEVANIDVVKKILKVLKKPETLINYVEDRLGHDRRYAIDSTKIREELGWVAKYDFDEGLAETINWYQNNQAWINEVLE